MDSQLAEGGSRDAPSESAIYNNAGLSNWSLAGTAELIASCRSVVVGIAISEVRRRPSMVWR